MLQQNLTDGVIWPRLICGLNPQSQRDGQLSSALTSHEEVRFLQACIFPCFFFSAVKPFFLPSFCTYIYPYRISPSIFSVECKQAMHIPTCSLLSAMSGCLYWICWICCGSNLSKRRLANINQLTSHIWSERLTMASLTPSGLMFIHPMLLITSLLNSPLNLAFSLVCNF